MKIYFVSNLSLCFIFTSIAASSAIASENAALDVYIARFDTGRNVTMGEFAFLFSHATGIACGYVEDPDPSDDIPFSITRDSVTPRSLLDEAVETSAPAHVWFATPSGRINILPRRLFDNKDSLLFYCTKDIQLYPKDLINTLGVFSKWLCDIYGDMSPMIGSAGSWPLLPDGTSILDRPIPVLTPSDDTLLSVMNAIFDAAGQDVSWSLSRSGFIGMARISLANVVTSDLATADAYIQTPAFNIEHALDLYSIALTTAPYSPLQHRILYTIANIELGNAGELAQFMPDSQPEYDKAAEILKELVSRPCSHADVHNRSLSQLLAISLIHDRKHEARHIIDSLIDSPDPGFRLDHLYASRIGIEVDNCDLDASLERLKNMRTVRSDNELFQQELEKRIAMVEIHSLSRSVSDQPPIGNR